MKLLIIGAGQHGMVAREIAELTGLFEVIDFLDDNSEQAVGKLDDYQTLAFGYEYGFVALGNGELRMQWIHKLEAAGYKLATIIHPTASISPSANIGQGVIVEGNAVVNTSSTVGKGCILSIGALVDHDSVVGEGCHVETGAVVMPNSEVAAGTTLVPNSVYQGR